MGVVIPEGFYNAVFRWSLTGDPEEMVTTLGGDSTSADTPAQLAEILYDATVATGSIADPAGMLANWTFVGVTVYLQSPGGLVVGIHNDPVSSASGNSSSPPTNCAVLVQKRTDLAGQRFRGRMFLPPAVLLEGGVNQHGVLESTEYSAVDAKVQEWIDLIEAGPYEPMLLHSDGGTPTPITSFILDTQIATQRRRMRN